MDMVTWIAVGSVATAAIVFLNLFLIFIKPRLEEPKFSIEFETYAPFCRQTTSGTFTSVLGAINTYWLRLRVKNSGKSVAQRCLGKLIKVMDSEAKVIDDFDPMQLHWVGTSWEAVPFTNISLNRQDYEYLDVLVTQEGIYGVYICGDQFVWAKYEQRGIKNSLEPGKYIIQITVYGDNVKPQTKYLSLIWRGRDYKDISVEIHDTPEKAKGWLKDKQND